MKQALCTKDIQGGDEATLQFWGWEVIVAPDEGDEAEAKTKI